MGRFTALVLAIILALPLGFGPTIALAAPRGHAFCLGGLSGNQELAKRLEESLKKDESGRTRLRGCHATPVQFLRAFREGDPGRTDLSLATLVRFVREDLELTEIDRTIKWRSSCVRGEDAGPDAVLMDCVVETVKAGVPVYKDRKTGNVVIKFDCVNPGLAPAERPPCDIIVADVRYPGVFEGGHPVYGPSQDATCHGYQFATVNDKGTLTLVGEHREFASGCDEIPFCSYEGADEAVKPRQRTSVVQSDLEPTIMVVFVSRKFSASPDTAFGFCIKYLTGSVPHPWATSMTVLVRAEDYTVLSNGQRRAWIPASMLWPNG